MRLKRVSITGFKTFADRTEFDVDGDLIAVVGPNGCGKSNLVDAILWGLGEGSAKHLRAQTGQDVIFGGSAKRRPVGFAEVTLLFDNEDGALPLACAEVAVSRRLNRAGDSQYSINRRACRLKDVLDLLADSGLGRAGYAIVGQREIDQALAASPEERRAWVDEAAGVQRYRARKIEAQRRLAAAQSHLDRVGDVIAEIELQREPLKAEAEVARRYLSVASALREVEVGSLSHELKLVRRDLSAVQERLTQAERGQADATARSEAARLAAEQVSTQLDQLEKALELAREDQRQKALAVQRWEHAITLAQQRLEAYSATERSLFDADMSGALEEARVALEVAKTEAVAEEQALQALRQEGTVANEATTKLRQKLRELDAELEGARRQVAEHLRLQANYEQAQSRLKSIRRELDGIADAMADLDAGFIEAEQSAEEAQKAFDAKVAEATTNRTRVEELRAAEAEMSKAVQSCLAKHAAMTGRIEGMRASIESHEGLQAGPRALLEAAGRGELKDLALIGDLLEVPAELTQAIEASLDYGATTLIVQNDRELGSAAAKLADKGRAAIAVADWFETAGLPEAIQTPGVVGWALDLVTVNSEAVRPMLDGILIVEDLETALRLRAELKCRAIVTLHGERIEPTGYVLAGPTSGNKTGLLDRRAELKTLETQAEQAFDDLTKAQQQLESIREASEACLASRAAIDAQRDQLRRDADEAKTWLRKVREERDASLRSKGKLEAEAAQLNDVKVPQQPLANAETLSSQRDAILAELSTTQAQARHAGDAIEAAEDRAARARERRIQAERRITSLQEAEATRQRKLTNLGPERERTQLEVTTSATALETARKEQAELAKVVEKQTSDRALMREKLQAHQTEEREQRDQRQAMVEACHAAEIARARLESRRAAAVQRLLEEYGIPEDAALQMEGEVPKDALQLVSQLRRELKSMGNVNVGAVDAYDRLTERYETLTVQREDVLGGIREITGSISELDGLTRQRFEDTLRAVQSAFEELFEKLFGGGAGRIELSRNDDVLESGIEIEVQLPGKARQKLDLLSGGERSLCAVAFLFSLLKVKPSPLVVLDEVDAPLDGRNVERFIALLKEFTATTQFVVITHNPTTIESAPVWLGVTMQEPGVSTLVPAKVSAPPMAVVTAS